MRFFRSGIFFFTVIVFCMAGRSTFAADKLSMAHVSPIISLSLPRVAKESGILARHDLAAEILLIPGSPRLVQTLISSDVDVIFVGVTALIRAARAAPKSRSSATRPISQAKRLWSAAVRKFTV